MPYLLVDQREIRKGDEESHTNTGHVTQTAFFENSRWQTAAILKIALSPYLSRELSDFDQIWYTQVQISIPSTENWQKNRNFSNSRRWTDAILKIVFWLYLGPYWPITAPYWSINANFGMEMKNHVQISVTWPKRQFPQIQDGGRPPFWK